MSKNAINTLNAGHTPATRRISPVHSNSNNKDWVNNIKKDFIIALLIHKKWTSQTATNLQKLKIEFGILVPYFYYYLGVKT